MALLRPTSSRPFERNLTGKFKINFSILKNEGNKIISRVANPQNVEEFTKRGQKLWKHIYEPFDVKLAEKLGSYHPDFICTSPPSLLTLSKLTFPSIHHPKLRPRPQSLVPRRSSVRAQTPFPRPDVNCRYSLLTHRRRGWTTAFEPRLWVAQGECG